MNQASSETKSRSTNWLLRILRYPRTQNLVIAILAVLMALVAISLVIVIIGKNPLTVFVSLLRGSGWLPKPRYASGRSMLTDFLGLLDALTPMIFAAIAVAIAFKAGLFNIGISGQMLTGGFLATVLIGYSQLDAVLAKPLVLLVGALSGAMLALFVGWLKANFNIHEVVSTIMLNYVVQYIVSFFIKGYFIEPVSRQSHTVSVASRLTLVNVQIGAVETRIPLCFLLAVGLAGVFYLILARTRLGYEIRAVGSNRQAAEYSGISSRRTIMLTMALSGAAAGLAGVTYYLGYYNSIMPGDLSSVGFDSIAVALLASANPLACVLSAMLITSLSYGSNYMSSVADVSEYIASLLIGIVLLFSACSGFLKYLVNRNNLAVDQSDDREEPGSTPATGGD
ncbi:MAG: ABC transporter permease [Coriobacteriales bacterium]|jgi:simple sugar transport system permease protein|nr:ABC transporter permease [Coriobacteriales bacterium]